MAGVADLDPATPHPIMLLGKRLVLWRDAQQIWRCLDDSCPHRCAWVSLFANSHSRTAGEWHTGVPWAEHPSHQYLFHAKAGPCGKPAPALKQASLQAGASVRRQD